MQQHFTIFRNCVGFMFMTSSDADTGIALPAPRIYSNPFFFGFQVSNSPSLSRRPVPQKNVERIVARDSRFGIAGRGICAISSHHCLW